MDFFSQIVEDQQNMLKGIEHWTIKARSIQESLDFSRTGNLKISKTRCQLQKSKLEESSKKDNTKTFDFAAELTWKNPKMSKTGKVSKGKRKRGGEGKGREKLKFYLEKL